VYNSTFEIDACSAFKLYPEAKLDPWINPSLEFYRA